MIWMAATNIEAEGRNMRVSQDRSLEVPYALQRVTIRFKSEKADLEAQEILGRMGKVHYFEGPDGKERVSITEEMLKVLEEKHIHFERITRPAPVSNTLRK